jgi:hypothetical protein
MPAIGLPLGDPAPPFSPLPADEARAVAALVGSWPTLS